MFLPWKGNNYPTDRFQDWYGLLTDWTPAELRYWWESESKEFWTSEDLENPESLSKDNLLFLQYTWLKDKNWTEIYEGDRITSTYFPAWTNIIVSWDDECSWFTPFTAPGIWGYERDNEKADRIEVIWNIYENK